MGAFPCGKCGELWFSMDAGASHVCNAQKVRYLIENWNTLLLKLREAADLLQEGVHWAGCDPTAEEATAMSTWEQKAVDFLSKYEQQKCAHVFVSYKCEKCGLSQISVNPTEPMPNCAHIWVDRGDSSKEFTKK